MICDDFSRAAAEAITFGSEAIVQEDLRRKLSSFDQRFFYKGSPQNITRLDCDIFVFLIEEKRYISLHFIDRNFPETLIHNIKEIDQ